MTPLVRLVAQRHASDCGVSALAMLLGVSYEEALLALGGEVPRILRRGVWATEIQRAAAKLGATLRVRRTWDAEADEGILWVSFRKGGQHVVLLRESLVFDTDLSVWAVDDYLRAKKAIAKSLIVREDA